MTNSKKRIWGWYFFDWASQPYNTLLVSFIFAPYVVSIIGDGSEAQALWGYGLGVSGMIVAVLSPVLGVIADRSGGRIGFISAFSFLYVSGSAMLWFSAPESFDIWAIIFWFNLGLIGSELATIFTNSMIADVAGGEPIGKISGSGWAFGYIGGIVALIIMLTLFAEGESVTTLIGINPVLGLDPAMREGTRAVGPVTAIWYVVFMIPFFLWVREAPNPHYISKQEAIRNVWPELKKTLSGLPKSSSLFAYLGSSTFYRDGLNGMYLFGGVYASGVLGWPVIQMGIFGIVAAISGALFAWLGGKADNLYGPKPVIIVTVATLSVMALCVVFISRETVFGSTISPSSLLPDILFYIIGAVIGAAGGSLQAASRTMMVRQAPAEDITQAFGIYALVGKATAFIAPLSIGFITEVTGSQQLGITPIFALFILGLILLYWVKPDGEQR